MASLNSYSYIYVDLETTGFYNNCEVLQIAALSEDNYELYCAYILPEENIPDEVTSLTGLKKLNEKLWYKDYEMETKSKAEAWRGFLKFLMLYKNVVLVGHNLLSFDYRFICNHLTSLNMFELFRRIVSGLCDTLLIAKKIYNDLESHSLSSMAKYFEIIPTSLHNAEGDVITLRKIIHKFPDFSVYNSVRYLEDYIKEQELKRIKELNKFELRSVFEDHLSKNLIGKLANSEITCESLIMIYSESGREGIQTAVKNVTRNENFINIICEVLSSYQPIYVSDRVNIN